MRCFMKATKPSIFAAFWFAVCAGAGVIGNTALHGQDKVALPELDGDWTQIYDEGGGNDFRTISTEQTLAANQPRVRGIRLESWQPLVWHLGRGTNRPGPFETLYVLHPAGKRGAIDLYHYENGNKGKLVQGLYSYKDGFLIVAMNFPDEDRPLRFGASDPKSPKEVYIFRKGLIK